MKKLVMLLSIGLIGLMSCNKDEIEPNLKSVYVATGTQVYEDAPVMNELENTLGAIVWTYESVGVYRGTLEGGFPLGKTHIVCNNGTTGFISSDLRHWDPDFVELRTFAGFNAFGDPKPSNGAGTVSFEIKIY